MTAKLSSIKPNLPPLDQNIIRQKDFLDVDESIGQLRGELGDIHAQLNDGHGSWIDVSPLKHDLNGCRGGQSVEKFGTPMSSFQGSTQSQSFGVQQFHLTVEGGNGAQTVNQQQSSEGSPYEDFITNSIGIATDVLLPQNVKTYGHSRCPVRATKQNANGDILALSDIMDMDQTHYQNRSVSTSKFSNDSKSYLLASRSMDSSLINGSRWQGGRRDIVSPTSGPRQSQRIEQGSLDELNGYHQNVLINAQGNVNNNRIRKIQRSVPALVVQETFTNQTMMQSQFTKHRHRLRAVSTPPPIRPNNHAYSCQHHHGDDASFSPKYKALIRTESVPTSTFVVAQIYRDRLAKKFSDTHPSQIRFVHSEWSPADFIAGSIDYISACNRKEWCTSCVSLACLILANKFIQDSAYANKSWSEWSEVPLKHINRMEEEVLICMDFNLHIRKEEFDTEAVKYLTSITNPNSSLNFNLDLASPTLSIDSHSVGRVQVVSPVDDKCLNKRVLSSSSMDLSMARYYDSRQHETQDPNQLRQHKQTNTCSPSRTHSQIPQRLLVGSKQSTPYTVTNRSGLGSRSLGADGMSLRHSHIHSNSTSVLSCERWASQGAEPQLSMSERWRHSPGPSAGLYPQQSSGRVQRNLSIPTIHTPRRRTPCKSVSSSCLGDASRSIQSRSMPHINHNSNSLNDISSLSMDQQLHSFGQVSFNQPSQTQPNPDNSKMKAAKDTLRTKRKHYLQLRHQQQDTQRRQTLIQQQMKKRTQVQPNYSSQLSTVLAQGETDELEMRIFEHLNLIGQPPQRQTPSQPQRPWGRTYSTHVDDIQNMQFNTNQHSAEQPRYDKQSWVPQKQDQRNDVSGLNLPPNSRNQWEILMQEQRRDMPSFV
eukprot:CFRG0836T1